MEAQTVHSGQIKLKKEREKTEIVGRVLCSVKNDLLLMLKQ